MGVKSVGIIGCGLIGNKRARFLKGARLGACCDRDAKRAGALAGTVDGCRATTDWKDVVEDPEIGIVVVATTHDLLSPIGAAAAAAGKHVLLEKPGGRTAEEMEPVAEAACRSGALVRIGFNHRYHRALRKAREIVDSGALGNLMFIRGRYGHGGRIGYDREWRACPEISGGGELIDQGMHLIDLSRWFLGDFVKVKGLVSTYFWDMPVEDNGFLLLENADGNVAFLQASCTEWKNLFSLEIYGKTGKLEVSGLGGSYGPERLTFYRMLPEMGPPPTQAWEYPMADDSWEAEWEAFLEDIRLNRQPSPGVADAQAALRAVTEAYRQSGQCFTSAWLEPVSLPAAF